MDSKKANFIQYLVDNYDNEDDEYNINNHINSITYATDVLNLSDIINYIDHLDEPFKEALNTYAKFDYNDDKAYYMKINTFLRRMGTRNYIQITDDLKDVIDKLDTIFENIPPIPQPFYVYRCWKEENMTNSVINAPGYLSTSLSIKVALSFCYLPVTNYDSYAENTVEDEYYGDVMKILIPAGTKIIPLLNMINSSANSEYEILLPRNGKLIKSREMEQDMYIYDDNDNYVNIINREQKQILNSHMYVYLQQEAPPITPITSLFGFSYKRQRRGGKRRKKTHKRKHK